MKYDLFNYPIIPDDIKPFRIPYMGSKNKIAIDLIRKMLEVKPKAKYFFDLFGGGGSVSFTALQIGLDVTYNELQTDLVNLLKYILDRSKKGLKGKYGLFPDEFYKFITREDFVRLKNESSILGQFARICYSFGNDQRSYAFGDIEKYKRLGHNIVMFQCKESLKEFNDLLKTNIEISNLPTWNLRRLDFIKQVKNRKYHELQRLQQLEQLQRLENLKIYNLNYKDVIINTPPEESIVYLDPPYRNTKKYIESKDFNYKELDDRFINNKYTCFMSEYNSPHKSIFEIGKLSLLDNSKETKKVVKEKLYWNER